MTTYDQIYHSIHIITICILKCFLCFFFKLEIKPSSYKNRTNLLHILCKVHLQYLVFYSVLPQFFYSSNQDYSSQSSMIILSYLSWASPLVIPSIFWIHPPFVTQTGTQCQTDTMTNERLSVGEDIVVLSRATLCLEKLLCMLYIHLVPVGLFGFNCVR